MNDYDEIVPYLFIGNENAALEYGNNFELVVNCTPDVEFPEKCKKRVRLPVDDHPKLAKKMYEYILETNVLEKIHTEVKNKKPVLVHCHVGMQRSCGVVACYLVKYYNVSPKYAVDYIKAHRPIAFKYGVNFEETIKRFAQ